MSTDGAMDAPRGGDDMSKRTSTSTHDERRAAALLARELAALDEMTAGELAQKYRELFGVPTRTRNKEYLRKRVAYRIQELAEGKSLTPRALERIDKLAPEAPARWRQPAESGTALASAPSPPRERDTRLPAPGTLIARVHDGRTYRVTILEAGFEFQGKQYLSLSKIAKVITGTTWNGFLFFFGRASRPGPQSDGGAE
jgi:hypothetical protein